MNCLSDMTINLAQSILRQQFPSVLGHEHTELVLRNMFTVRKISFLQILYGNYRWVIVFGNEKSEISFYDSPSNGNTPRVFLHQICHITQPATNKISVKVQLVQQQSNQVDCGVFSIAFAVTLALGDNSALVTYEQTSLRFHLDKCLKLDKFFPYPVLNGKRQKRAKEITITKDVYCTCRRTYFQEDTEESPDNFMAPRIGVIKSAWIFPLKYFEVILLQRYGSANLARKNTYNLAITFTSSSPTVVECRVYSIFRNLS